MGMVTLVTRFLPFGVAFLAIGYFLAEHYGLEQVEWLAGMKEKSLDSEKRERTESDEACPICCNNYDNKRRSRIEFEPCQHTVCLTCSARVVATCPMCRTAVKDRRIVQKL